jgi:hypothetical protein
VNRRLDDIISRLGKGGKAIVDERSAFRPLFHAASVRLFGKATDNCPYQSQMLTVATNIPKANASPGIGIAGHFSDLMLMNDTPAVKKLLRCTDGSPCNSGEL